MQSRKHPQSTPGPADQRRSQSVDDERDKSSSKKCSFATVSRDIRGKPSFTILCRFTPNAELCTEVYESFVLLLMTLSFVFTEKGSRKRRLLKSVSNAKKFVLGQPVICFVVMHAPPRHCMWHDTALC